MSQLKPYYTPITLFFMIVVFVLVGTILPIRSVAQISQPGGTATACGGDLTGTFPNCNVASVGGKAISLAGALTHAGAFARTITATATSVSTLPAGTHTLAQTDAPTFTGSVTGGAYLGSSDIQAGITGAVYFNGRSAIRSSANGNLQLSNLGGTDVGLIELGCLTSACPALKRSSTSVLFRLADDSADAPISAADALVTNQKSTTGQRFVCIDTTGKLVSSTTACVGT